MNSNGTELEQVIHAHRTSCRSGWPRGFVELNPGSPHAEYLAVSIRSSPLLYLFTSATVRIPVRALQLRSVTEIAPKSLFLCVKRSRIRYDFRACAEAIR